jgi:hypothetical protein
MNTKGHEEHKGGGNGFVFFVVLRGFELKGRA